MKELIKRWRAKDDMCGYRSECADELQAWINSLWTEITDDPATWPTLSTPVALAGPEHRGFYEFDTDWQRQQTIGPRLNATQDYTHWRSLIPGIDTVE